MLQWFVMSFIVFILQIAVFILNPDSKPNFLYMGNKAVNLLDDLNRNQGLVRVCVCAWIFFTPLLRTEQYWEKYSTYGDIKDSVGWVVCWWRSGCNKYNKYNMFWFVLVHPLINLSPYKETRKAE